MDEAWNWKMPLYNNNASYGLIKLNFQRDMIKSLSLSGRDLFAFIIIQANKGEGHYKIKLPDENSKTTITRILSTSVDSKINQTFNEYILNQSSYILQLF